LRTTRNYRLNPLACAYCAKCHYGCPTYEATGNEGFAARGKILLAGALAGDLPPLPASAADGNGQPETDWRDSRELAAYLDFCLRCYRCLDLCPAQMATVPIFEHMRFEVAQRHPPDWRYRWLMRSVLPQRSLTRFCAALGALPFSLLPLLARRVSLGRRLEEALAQLPRHQFHSTFASRSPTLFAGRRELPLPATALERGQAFARIRSQQRVTAPARGVLGYFLDCLTDLHFPSAFAGTVRLLNALGYEVQAEFAAPCCGASALNTGDEAAFEHMAKLYAQTFAKAPYERILFTNPTCYKTVKERYPDVLGDGAIAGLPEPVLDVELYAELPPPPLHPAWHTLNLAWHNPCALGYALGDKSTAVKVLTKWGLQVRQFPEVEGCCGYGGLFYLRYPEFAAKQSARKLRAWQEAGIDLVLSCSAGCIGHLNATAIRERIPLLTVHWGELG